MPKSVSLDGLDPELRKRTEAVLTEGGDTIWVSSAKRSFASQTILYTKYLLGLGPVAAKPGTSQHEKGLAVDIDGDNTIRVRLTKKYGLVRTVPSEEWHYELADAMKLNLTLISSSKSFKTTKTTKKETKPEVKEVEELPKYIDKAVWDDGSSAQVFVDGGVECFPKENFRGSVPMVKPADRKTFGEAAAINANDPKNVKAGYTVFNPVGDTYRFDEAEFAQLTKK